jgi:hypothetical protein
MGEESGSNAVEESKEKLPLPWQRIQGAVWLIGLAIIAWKDWWWPGILVLVAISGLTQAAIQFYLSSREETQQQLAQQEQIEKQRAEWLPDICPNCGGPLSVSTVHWTSPGTADCPYCKANLKRPA